MTKYEIVIPVGNKDVKFVPRVVDCITRCLSGYNSIYILTAERNIPKLRTLLRDYDECIIIDEDKLINGLSFESIRTLLHRYSPQNVNLTGWYFQQFLKYGFAFSDYCSDYYLTWDADTLPLAPIVFFEKDHILFNPKHEYNPNYFKTIEKILGIGKVADYSFISENMMFSKDIVRRMLKEIEAKDINNLGWIEKIISVCDFSDNYPAFSEFETYGSYCYSYYPRLYKRRYLNTFREAGMISGRFISEKRLRILSFDIDTASFELRHEPLFPYNYPQMLDRIFKYVSMSPIKLVRKIINKYIRIKTNNSVNEGDFLCRLPPRKNKFVYDD